MAERLGLLVISEDPPHVVEHELNADPVLIRGSAHVAWGTFNWLSLHSQYYGEPAPRLPPPHPVPVESQWGRLPQMTRQRTPTDTSVADQNVFARVCEFRIMMNEVILNYYPPGNTTGNITERIPLEFARGKYHELLAWASKLGSDMTRSWQASNHVLVLQYVHIFALGFPPADHPIAFGTIRP